MNWLARLKSPQSPRSDAREPREPTQGDPQGGFLGLLAPVLSECKKYRADPTAANDPAPTPITVMNPRERDTTTARLARFSDKGMTHDDAQLLADKLLIRDRESDDRRLCLECTHLTGYGRTSWRCSNWQRAGVAIRARDNQLPVDLVLQLQRCDGLTHAFNPTTEVS